MDRNLIFLKIYFYFYFLPMCMSVLPVCTPVFWAHAWHLWGQEKGVTPPETRIVNVACCHVGTGYRTQVFWRESQVLVLSLLCSPSIIIIIKWGAVYTHHRTCVEVWGQLFGTGGLFFTGSSRDQIPLSRLAQQLLLSTEHCADVMHRDIYVFLFLFKELSL